MVRTRNWLLIGMLAAPVLAHGEALPPDIANFLDRVERCERAARLESYENERRDQVHQTYENLRCRNLVHDEALLRDQFSDNQTALDALDSVKHAHPSTAD
jgi:flagellar biosynthesis/type III secretory pathway chaperone